MKNELIDIEDANAIGESLTPIGELLLDMSANAIANGGTMATVNLMELSILLHDLNSQINDVLKKNL